MIVHDKIIAFHWGFLEATTPALLFWLTKPAFYAFNIPDRRFTTPEEKTGLSCAEAHAGHRRVIPCQMTYLHCVVAQTPY